MRFERFLVLTSKLDYRIDFEQRSKNRDFPETLFEHGTNMAQSWHIKQKNHLAFA